MGTKIVNRKSTKQEPDLRAENERLRKALAGHCYMLLDMIEKLESVERMCREMLEEKA